MQCSVNVLALNIDQYMEETLITDYRNGVNKDLEVLVFGNNSDILDKIVKDMIYKFSIRGDMERITNFICNRAIDVAKDILEFEYDFQIDG